MNERVAREYIIDCNKDSLRALARALIFSQNQFSLIAVRCNHTSLPQAVIQHLEEVHLIPTRSLVLPKSAQALYTTLQKELRDEQQYPVIICGLESVFALDDFLVSTNQVRDVFRNSFSFPIVLWLNDELLRKLSRLAPDFNNWLAPPIQFTLPADDWPEPTRKCN